MNTATYHIEKYFWKRLSLAGFVFFLVKGLVWVVLPVLMYWLGAPG